MDEKIERRYFDVEIRADADDDFTLVGHPAMFNKLSVDLGGFREKIAPGAFANTIKEDDIRGLYNHNPLYVFARNKSGTLELTEDKQGLFMRANPADTSWVKDMLITIERGDVSQMSFGFNVLVEEWDEKDQDNIIRTLKEVKLYDVSPVAFPAYPDTDVALRSLGAWREIHNSDGTVREVPNPGTGIDENIVRALKLREREMKIRQGRI